jgi:hypothetical protein
LQEINMTISFIRAATFANSLLFFVGCAVVPPTSTVTHSVEDEPPQAAGAQGLDSGEADNEGNAWWKVSVRMVWPQEQDVAWHMDALLAQEVFAPLLKRYEPKLPLWRFHRRAARDGGGHRFTFHFYTDKASAARVLALVQSNELLDELKQANLVSKVSVSDIDKTTPGRLGANADPRWSVAVQQAWPYFIKGVSEMWLKLVQDYVAQARAADEAASEEGIANGDDMTALQKREALYERAEQAVRAVWKNEGGHAMLHHLNALYGYEDIIVYERRITRF